MDTELHDLPPYEAFDTVGYELLNYAPHELYHCSTCRCYRHRRVVKGQRPAICCGKPAKLLDKYSQPTLIIVEQAVDGESGPELVRLPLALPR
jgi:hypothetical protein